MCVVGGIDTDMSLRGMIEGFIVPEGCRLKAVVQCRGQRAGREQAQRYLRVAKITG